MKPFFPPAFLEKYRQLMGNEFDEFVRISSTPHPKSLWVNSLKIRPTELKTKLEMQGWKLKPLPFHENAFEILEGPIRPGQSEEFKTGLFNLQEKASMLPALALNPQPGERVLDACAAPGNKTLQLACLMKGKGEVVAVDKNTVRMKSLKFNVGKFGMKNVQARLGNLLKASTRKAFDRILLDAPCSSEGVVRKDPEALTEWSPELVESKSQLQKKLILKAFSLLKFGGTLVYSTCSLSPEENEEVIAYLLRR
ncbi:MAG: RsmB/NOP family class I SAM-dependent RNA methyltransferase, partial [Candidatus Diapherotrites archaeon]|nr:RsmB/NOP family class I SAM-dependent RNA methyltransferase [Candidatus Diapherotrites archaeon]